MLKISVVIPSFNQGIFLEEALRSVLEQNYSEKEVIVIDGASTDGSVEILRSYEGRLAYWISERDGGQTDAINKGLVRITGDVWMYLNSDDLLLPGALSIIARAFANPEVTWVGGSADVFDNSGIIGEIVPAPQANPSDYLRPWNRPDRYVFPFSGANIMRRAIYNAIGPMDAGLHYSMDIEFYLRAVFQGGFRPTLVPEKLAAWRWHQGSKTMQAGIAYGFRRDEVAMARRYRSYLPRKQRSQLDRELKFEEKQLISREAIYWRNQDQIGKSLFLVLGGPLKYPSLLVFRPWWGAIKRLLPFLRRMQQNSFIRPGRWLYLLRSLGKRDPCAIFHEKVTLPKICEWRCPDFPSSGADLEVHLLTGESEAFLALWMLASWHHATERRWTIVLHDDGTLTDRSIDVFRNAFYDRLRIIRRPEADEAMAAHLATKPGCRAYREQHALALKIFDVPVLASSSRIILLDSDLLFFRRPERLLQWVVDSEEGSWFNEDAAEGTLISREEAEQCLGVQLWPRVNSGLCLLWRNDIDLEFCERALARTSITGGNEWRIEQTLFALCASRSGKGGLLPSAYEVSLGKFASPGAVARHYVGAVRDRFFAEGLPRVAPVLVP